MNALKIATRSARLTVSARTLSTAAAPRATVPPSGWQNFKKNWLMDSACYPIIAIIAGACTMVVVASTRQLTGNPDVRFDKADREEMIPDNEREARKHFQHGMREHAKKDGATQPMYKINKFATGQ